MKVKNIVFSGFAAAILMGTANATVTPMKIASQAYVDAQTKMTVNNTEQNVTTVVAGLINGDNSVDSKIDDALGDDFTGQNGFADVTAALATKQGTLTAGDNITISNGTISATDTIYTAGDTVTISGNDNIINVNAVNSTTGIAAVSSASDTAFPTEKAVATALATKASTSDLNSLANRVTANEDIIAGDNETIPSTIGSTQNVTTIVGAINALKTKTDSMATSDTMTQVTSDVAALQTALGTGFGSGNTVASAVASKQNAITDQAKLSADLVDDSNTTNKFVTASDITAWNANTTAIGDANSGLTKKVADLETTINTTGTGLTDRVVALESTVNTASTGLSAKVTALETKATGYDALKAILEGYSECISAIEAAAVAAGEQNPTGHCVLSASTSGQIEWAPVTFPWVEE